MSLFAYGTLRFPEVWQRIGIGEFPSEPATLSGYAIFRVQDAVFPGIVRSADDDQVCGVLYHNLDDDTFFELDAYESELYERIVVRVTTESGAEVDCQAFVIPESRRQALTDEHWDVEHFKQHELQKYLSG